MSINKVKYLVLGAGISGLTFAANKLGEDLILIEKEEHPGGLCKTFHKDGYVWDIAGHFFHFHSASTKQFFLDLMGNTDMRSATKCAKVYYNGKYMDAPFQYNIHQLPQSEFFECLTDMYYASDEEKEGFAEYVISKYGNGIASKFLIPYNEKLYACNLDNLDKDAMGEFLPKLNFKMLMEFYKGYKGSTYNDYFEYPVNGCGEIINALEERIPIEKIHLGEEVVKVDYNKKIVWTNKNEYKYEYLINTIPLNNFTNMCGIANREFRYNKVLVLNMGFDLPSIDKEVSWIYFPGKEIFYRVGFFNNIAGTKRLSIYVEIGYGSEDQIELEIAIKRTLDDLKKVNIIDQHILVSYMSYIISPAYVHLSENSRKYTFSIIEKMKEKGIYTLGRYGRWEYSAMDDSIEQAIELCDII